jgi:hypothetical protein
MMELCCSSFARAAKARLVLRMPGIVRFAVLGFLKSQPRYPRLFMVMKQHHKYQIDNASTLSLSHKIQTFGVP